MKKEQIKIARVRHEVNKRSIITRVPIKQIPTWTIKKTQKTENQIVQFEVSSVDDIEQQDINNEEAEVEVEATFLINFNVKSFDLTPDQYPIIRDLKNELQPLAPLERYFGCLQTGNLFGESCMFAADSSMLAPTVKFYDAFGITDCYYLTLQRVDLKRVWYEAEQRRLKEHINFLTTIPEF